MDGPLQGCRKWASPPLPLPQFLAKQLTLSQPGGQIMPTTVLRAPLRIFRPYDDPVQDAPHLAFPNNGRPVLIFFAIKKSTEATKMGQEFTCFAD